MERFVKGEIVIIPFPFSDLSSSRKRPALILANLNSDDLILCQITSQLVKDDFAISINNQDFKTGSLHKPSNIRPNRLFTAEKSIILKKAGTLTPQIFNVVIQQLHSIFRPV